MTPKQLTILLTAILGLVIIDGFMVFRDMAYRNETESLHDRLIIAETQVESWRDAYNKLLEKIGGADPFTPVRPGKLGDKQ